MHEQVMKSFKSLVCLIMLAVPFTAQSATNIAMSQFLNDIRGSSFNLLIAEPHIIDIRNSKRRKRAIYSGFKKELRNMNILLRKLKLNAKLRSPGLSNDIPQYQSNDKAAGKKLYKLIKDETTLWLSKLSEDIVIKGNKKEATEEGGELSDDIGADIDFDTDIVEVTDDKLKLRLKESRVGKD